MAELIIGTVALGVAGPSVIVSFVQCGEYFKEQISRLQKAPSILQELARYGSALYNGRIKDDLSLACWAYEQDNISASLKDILEDQVERLRAGLIQADRALQKSFDKKGEVKRGYFFTVGERRVRKALEDLDKWQDDFWASITMIDMQTRHLPNPLLLTPNIFRTQEQSYSQEIFQSGQGRSIWVAKGEIAQQTIREMAVLVERKTGEVIDVASIARCLTQQSQSGSNRGILRCVGYRENPYAELIFEIPGGMGDMRTLQKLISADQGHDLVGARPLDYRFQLSHRIAEAVLSVHASRCVHKNIRSSNILLLKPDVADEVEIGTPFLIDWLMLRAMNLPSFMAGERDWQENIYRHPQRQGLQPQKRYNMGHDIYSLGVCLLEIGLWEPLAVDCNGQTGLNARYERVVRDQNLVNSPDSSDLQALTRPLVVQKGFVALAKKELPSRMGIAFAELVISCLTCLEGGFGSAQEFEENKVDVGVKFRDIVLQPLSALA